MNVAEALKTIHVAHLDKLYIGAGLRPILPLMALAPG